MVREYSNIINPYDLLEDDFDCQWMIEVSETQNNVCEVYLVFPIKTLN